MFRTLEIKLSLYSSHIAIQINNLVVISFLPPLTNPPPVLLVICRLHAPVHFYTIYADVNVSITIIIVMAWLYVICIIRAAMLAVMNCHAGGFFLT